MVVSFFLGLAEEIVLGTVEAIGTALAPIDSQRAVFLVPGLSFIPAFRTKHLLWLSCTRVTVGDIDAQVFQFLVIYFHNDIIFKVIDIKGDICYLCGVSIRLFADSFKDDLVIVNKEDFDEDFDVSFDDYKTLDRNEYFYLPGKVLHIDGDNEFLDKCMNFYKRNKIKAYGIYLNEGELANNIFSYLEKYVSSRFNLWDTAVTI